MNYPDFFRGLYSRTYAEGSEWLRVTVPGLTREQLLPLLLRCIYIPEALAVGAAAEKLHTEASELLLGRAFSLMGLDVVALRRNTDCPDLAGISLRNNYRFVADAKCMRLSSGRLNRRMFNLDMLHTWRLMNKMTSFHDFYHGLTPVEVELEVRRHATDVWHFYADGRRRKRLDGIVPYLSGTNNWYNDQDGAIYVMPMYMLPLRASKFYESCCDFDATVLPWEHVYSLLRLGVTEESGRNLQDLFHLSKRIRKSRSDNEWCLIHLPEEDRLVAEVAGVSVGSLRDGIQVCMEAMRAMVLEELEALPDAEAEDRVHAAVNAGRLRSQVGNAQIDAIKRLQRRRPGLLRALQYCDLWDELRNNRK